MKTLARNWVASAVTGCLIVATIVLFRIPPSTNQFGPEEVSDLAEDPSDLPGKRVDELNWRALGACATELTSDRDGTENIYGVAPSDWSFFGGSNQHCAASQSQQLDVAQKIFANRGKAAWPKCGVRLYPEGYIASSIDVLVNAKKLEGVPYEWGGTTEKGLGTSGFVRLVYARSGIKLKGETSQRISENVEPVLRSEAMPGDLVFMGSGDMASNIGIFAGGGVAWTAGQSGQGVALRPVYNSFVTFGRASSFLPIRDSMAIVEKPASSKFRRLLDYIF